MAKLQSLLSKKRNESDKSGPNTISGQRFAREDTVLKHYTASWKLLRFISVPFHLSRSGFSGSENSNLTAQQSRCSAKLKQKEQQYSKWPAQKPSWVKTVPQKLVPVKEKLPHSNITWEIQEMRALNCACLTLTCIGKTKEAQVPCIIMSKGWRGSLTEGASSSTPD